MRKVAPLLVILGFLAMVAIASIPVRVSVQVDRGSIASSPAWPGLTRIAPIAVTSDADWSTYAASGDGSSGNPWVIEGFLIECNSSGSGVGISGTTDHVIIRNGFINETGSGATDCGILIQGSTNIAIDNVTIEYAENLGIAIIGGHIDVSNCTIADSTAANLYIESSYDVSVSNSNLTLATPGVLGNIFVGNLLLGNGSTRISFTNVTVDDASTFSYVDNVDIENSVLNATNMLYCENVTVTGVDFIGYLTLTTNIIDIMILSSTFVNTTSGINSAGAGIIDSLTIANCTFTNVGSVVQLNSDTNILISNNTLTNCTSFISGSAVNKIVVRNNTVDSGSNSILLQTGSTNILITGTTIHDINGTAIRIIDGINTTISYNTIWNVENIAISIDGGSLYRIIGNDIRHVQKIDTVTITGSVSIGTIIDNYFFCPGNTTHDPDAGIWFDTGSGDDVLIANNTFDSINDTTNGNAIIWYDGTNVTVTGNTFIDNRNAFSISGATIDVFGNYFINNENILQAGTDDPNTIHHNFYYDYFDVFPYAITSNATTDVLEYEYIISATINDTYPIYHADWYPVSQVVNIRVYSNVDGQGIIFDNLKIYVDSVQIATASPTIEHVLFRLTIEDFKGRLLWDQVYNLNDTGTNLNIGVDIAVQVFFHFYSTIDYFGLDFEIVKLYIDGVRITRYDPIMELKTITVVVRDYADSVLYNQLTNLSTTGVYLDIGLAIGLISFRNNFNETAVFYLTKGGVTISYAIPAQTSIQMRLAMGTYEYVITDTRGHVLVEDTTITFSAARVDKFVVAFGWTSVEPDSPINNYSTSLLDYVVVIAILGAAFAFTLVLVTRASPGKKKSNAYTRKHR